MNFKEISLALSLTISGIFVSRTVVAQGRNPNYVHAMNNLIAARWALEHKTGDWAQRIEESDALRELNECIRDIQGAGLDLNGYVNYSPKMTDYRDHGGRLNQARGFLINAKNDLNSAGEGNGIRGRSLRHCEGALQAIERARRY